MLAASLALIPACGWRGLRGDDPPNDYPSLAIRTTDPAQLARACGYTTLASKHYDVLPTVLVRRAANGSVSGRVASTTAFRGLEKLDRDERDFRNRLRPIALLTLGPGAGPSPGARTICLLSGWDTEVAPDPRDSSAWRVVFFDVGSQAVVQGRLLYREGGAGSADEEEGTIFKRKLRPRPAARLHFRPTTTRSWDDGAFVAWYRCGSGCCGAGLEDFY